MRILIREEDECEWCVVRDRHGHTLRDDDTLGIVVLTAEQLAEYGL